MVQRLTKGCAKLESWIQLGSFFIKDTLFLTKNYQCPLQIWLSYRNFLHLQGAAGRSQRIQNKFGLMRPKIDWDVASQKGISLALNTYICTSTPGSDSFDTIYTHMNNNKYSNGQKACLTTWCPAKFRSWECLDPPKIKSFLEECKEMFSWQQLSKAFKGTHHHRIKHQFRPSWICLENY